jgi:1,4-alpha-glucan branching enzyme
MTTGTATFVLHSHLPYCRLAGRWPHGEEWLHEAMLECYLPLAAAFTRLAKESPGSLGVTLNMTPILAEQIRDPLVIEHFRDYIAGRIARARTDAARFGDVPGLRGQTAAFHRDRHQATQSFFEDQLHGDLLAGLAALEASGHIEIATSAATHGYLPLLEDEAAIRFQVQTGVQSHIRNFGRAPRSFWLPECAYRPGLETYLAEAGIKVFFVETHLITGGTARGKAAREVIGPYEFLAIDPTPIELPPRPLTTFKAYRVGDSGVAAIGRNERTGKQVWSAEYGYPGDPAYREFHKKDDISGLHYWRVTGDKVDLGMKAEYDAAAAAEVVGRQADHFHGLVKAELDGYRATAGQPGICLQSYDTELFGHWWFEGVAWVEGAIRRLRADPDVDLSTAGDYVSARPPTEAASLPEGSWGDGGDSRTWQNAGTAWTWPEIRARQARAAALLTNDSAAARQLARELLLLQSSDWQFLMTTKQAADYATERFRSHMERFDALAGAMESDSPVLEALVAEYESLDNPFPDINVGAYRAAALPARA